MTKDFSFPRWNGINVFMEFFIFFLYSSQIPEEINLQANISSSKRIMPDFKDVLMAYQLVSVFCLLSVVECVICSDRQMDV